MATASGEEAAAIMAPVIDAILVAPHRPPDPQP
jgi:hypothetical protein